MKKIFDIPAFNAAVNSKLGHSQKGYHFSLLEFDPYYQRVSWSNRVNLKSFKKKIKVNLVRSLVFDS